MRSKAGSKLVPLVAAGAVFVSLLWRSVGTLFCSAPLPRGFLRSAPLQRALPSAGVSSAEVKTEGPRIEIFDAVLSPAQIEQTVRAVRSLADDFRDDADSVDGQPSFEFEFITSGEWRADAGDLPAALTAPLTSLTQRVRQLYEGQHDGLMISQALIRRYAVGERRAHPVHYDHHALLTAVCSLTPPSPGSGLYVQHGAHVSTREFVDLKEAGNFAVHGWDLAHGVAVRAEEERYSLIVWFKPAADIASGGTGWYQALAESGHAVAQYRVGMNLESSGDPVSAMQWFEKAAQQGHWSSMHRLGRTLFRGRGDLDGAERWLTWASQLGYAPAQVELGDLLAARSGEPPPRQSSAGTWYASAAEQGHPAGQHRLALATMRDGDERSAVNLLSLAAEQGWADAQFEMGRLLKQTDPNQAFQWLEKAAGQGHPGAMNQLAIACSMANEHEKARHWLQQAAERGHVTAMKNLAMYLEQGVGGLQDEAAATMWKERAAQR